MISGNNTGLLAGIGVTRLRVYDQRPAPDGTLSGCAHVHAFTDEAYYIVDGSGSLELHDAAQGFRQVPLRPGSFVQFGPGTLHRSVCDGHLDILVLMSNAGLAERGDARIYFGPTVDADADAYERLRSLPREQGLDGALQRRDASTRAYTELMRLWAQDRPAYFVELQRFVALHHRQAALRAAQFEAVVDQGPGQWLRQSLGRLRGAAPGAAGAGACDDQSGAVVLGMCGLLRQLPDPAPV